MKWSTQNFNGLSDPRVWGPPFWFSLHVSAASYPIHPSQIVRERAAFVEKHRKDLDNIVSSRQNLFNFYVDFHNKVNQRYGKKIWSYKEAMEYYTGGAAVRYLQY
jgi:hypothetical protein